MVMDLLNSNLIGGHYLPKTGPESVDPSLYLVLKSCRMGKKKAYLLKLLESVWFKDCVVVTFSNSVDLLQLLYPNFQFSFIWFNSRIVSDRICIVFLNLYSAAHGRDHSVTLPSAKTPRVEIGFKKGERC